jgi:hypothetical protein
MGNCVTNLPEPNEGRVVPPEIVDKHQSKYTEPDPNMEVIFQIYKYA